MKTGLLLICIVVILHDAMTYDMMCPDGEAHNRISANAIDFTCKTLRGRLSEGVTCQTKKAKPSAEKIVCQNNGFVGGWKVKDDEVTIKCCTSPRLEGMDRDCKKRLNDKTANNQAYRVKPGKVITAFKAYEGEGWWNWECSYKRRSN